ncbi:peptidoglycan-binding protein [Niveispirillum sp. BGYR6]|uniref:peptidoglycan-binding domain-containing protein n=1 Tax=Niveispirillum sp. BGYR6 TaxID=2971249 RepID=UPI0022B9BEF5|nr:peptidoglycan-binding protein [Niveispirillum sp. BGYR6]MDG5497784.1 peptidoglycan-binding domain-containing protein [Niveispirillum sp. BGYR6]
MRRLSLALMALFAAPLLASPALAAPQPEWHRACAADGVVPLQSAPVIKQIQTELAIAGFDAGKPDGAVGRGTRQAIRDYQKLAGLKPDGCPSEALLQRLSFGLPKVYSDRRPAMPTETVQVQEELLRRGYWAGPADGRLGKTTVEAIRQFELDNDRPLTGEVSSTLLRDLKTGDLSKRRN